MSQGMQPDPIQLHDALNDTSNAIDKLNATITQLYERLGPVLRPEQPTPTEDAKTARQSASPMAETARDHTHRLEAMMGNVLEILSRLDV